MSLDHYSGSLRYIILLKNFVNYIFLFKAIQSIEAGGNDHCCSSIDTTCCCFDNTKTQLKFKWSDHTGIVTHNRKKCVSYDNCDKDGWRC